MNYPNQAHYEQVLTNFCLFYLNNQFIGDNVIPVFPVNKPSDLFYVFDPVDFFKITDDSIAPNALPNEAAWKVFKEYYSVKDRGLSDWLPAETLAAADAPLKPLTDTVEFLMMLSLLKNEKRAAELAFTAANYPAGYKMKLSGDRQWGKSGSTAYLDVKRAIKRCFIRANTLVYGSDTWMYFASDRSVVKAIKGDIMGGSVTEQEVAAYFKVDEVLIGESKFDAVKKGENIYDASYVWGPHFAALHVNKKPGVKSIGWAVKFRQTAPETTTDFDKKRGKKGSYFIKVTHDGDERIIAPSCGTFIEDAVEAAPFQMEDWEGGKATVKKGKEEK
jgi:hypothetical protein